MFGSSAIPHRTFRKLGIVLLSAGTCGSAIGGSVMARRHRGRFRVETKRIGPCAVTRQPINSFAVWPEMPHSE